MPKKYKYVNGNKMIVVNNYDLGTDVIPEEEQIVPDPLVTDVGKVLTVNQAGNPAWADAPEELPSLTGNAGKVLTVSSGASGVEWADVPTELPAVTSADEGDVLTVNASGEWEAAAPASGGLTLYGPYEAIGSYQTVSSGGFYEDYAITNIVSRDPVYDLGENVRLPDGDTPGKCLLVSFTTANDFMVTSIELPTYSPPEDPYPGEWSSPKLLCENMSSSDNSMSPSIYFLSTVRLPIVENS